MTAHIFIVHGDIRQLACDAWLMPCGPEFKPSRRTWYPSAPRSWAPQARCCDGPDFIRRLANWPPEPERDAALPEPWLVNVVGGQERSISWFVERATSWVRSCAASIRSGQAELRLRQRDRPLLALPLIGTGGGGAAYRAGDVAAQLLPALQESATEAGVDIALVLLRSNTYAATLRVREDTLGADPRRWPVALNDEEAEVARTLARKASEGSLVLFVGAGVSIGAGLPSWDGMLTRLAEREGIIGPRSSDAEGQAIDPERFVRLNPLDRARLIEVELQRRGDSVAGALRRIFSLYRRPSLAHALLAMLPCREAVTTNYDRLFEIACAGAGEPVSSLPWDVPMQHRRWLLKLHGCLDHPEDLVFTRADYLRYDERRAALKGIVQAMLMTRWMLFVGFSMNDDNFHRIVDDVRKARGRERSDASRSEHIGTTLMLRRDPIFETLWGNDLQQASLEAPEKPGNDAAAARRLEVFLDALAHHAATDSVHLLDGRFDAILTDPERRLRDLLIELVHKADPEVKRSAAWARIAELLRELGADDIRALTPENDPS